MRLFSKKEIDKKRNESIALTAKKGLDIARELDKNLKALHQSKEDHQQLIKEYENEQEEAQAKRRTLQIEIQNLQAEKAKEMKPVTELLVEAANRVKEVERREFDLEQREIAHNAKLDELHDQLDVVASRWGEARVMEGRLQKKTYGIIKEEARITAKNKVVTNKLEELNTKSVQFEKRVKDTDDDLSLKKNEVDAYWRVIGEREEAMETREKKLQAWEVRLAAHQKRLNK